jgi:riboflavin kinase/FMN adenylyltransferase
LAGNIEVAHLLGRPYQVNGLVVPGDGRGCLIGSRPPIWTYGPSVLSLCRSLCLPGLVEQLPHGSVTNVGVRPTFESGPVTPRVETHLLDYSGDLYGKQLHLDFLARLRDEQRFPSVEDLVAQIHSDIAQARQYLDSRFVERP